MWSSTVGLLKEGRDNHGCSVTASCSKCVKSWPVDLDAIIEKFGPDYSLWNKAPLCKNGCGYRVFFSANASKSTPLINLRFAV